MGMASFQKGTQGSTNSPRESRLCPPPRSLSPQSSELQSSEDGGSSTIAEILSILQDEPQDDPNPAEPSESHPGGQEAASLAPLASKEEEPMADPGLDLLAKEEEEGKSDPGLASKEEIMKSEPGLAPLPCGEDNPKLESPPPSEGPQEAPRRLSEGDRMKPKGHHGSRYWRDPLLGLVGAFTREVGAG